MPIVVDALGGARIDSDTPYRAGDEPDAIKQEVEEDRFILCTEIVPVGVAHSNRLHPTHRTDISRESQPQALL